MMTTSRDDTEREMRRRAIDYACPTCGAKATIRCRVVTHRPTRPGYVAGTKGDVKQNPCPERATLVWRDMLANHSEETS